MNVSNEKLKKMSEDPLAEILYFQVTDLWKRFCEEHTRLFNATCDEYECLLDNDIDRLEVIIDNKQKIINKISLLEKLRKEVIENLNETIDERYKGLLNNDRNISSIKELLIFITKFEQLKSYNHLQRFNNLLIDLIEKTQEQNKKNQLYINRAVKNLDELKKGIMGERPYKTYTSLGTTKYRT
ncbi:MAG: flagellar protein FlgN [Candidatus Heimdallarchaeota archaeon]|jgi:hypothetical protein|nr:flagellar protein FlgN [Bdellovibrionales bacterium]MDH5647689.1 flagellar protein FlgN [Candidatus Heimdallarchaeota archaeon]